MKKISPIEVVAQTGLNRVQEDDYRAPRQKVKRSLSQMYPGWEASDIELAIDRAVEMGLVLEEDDYLIVP